MERARSILLKSELPENLWTKVVNTTNYVVNRSPSQANQGKTPKELFSRQKPNLQHLRIFGCNIHTLIMNSTKKPLDPKSKLYWLVGYDTNTKTYKLFNPRAKKVVLSCDFTFDETCIGSRIHKTSKVGISSL